MVVPVSFHVDMSACAGSNLAWDCLLQSAHVNLQINPCTAYGLLQTAGVPKGKWIIQTAAGSSLGRQFIDLAKHSEVKTINVVRRSSQKEELLKLG